MKKVILIQRSVPNYRIEFFKKLGSELFKKNVQLQVVHSSSDINDDDLFFYLSPSIDFRISFLRKERFLLCLNLYRHFKINRPDYILTEDISNLPNGLLVTIYGLLNKCSYTIMGLGKILANKESILKKILKLPILFFRKNAKSFLSYSTTGAEYYKELYNKESISWMNSVVDFNDVNKVYLEEKYKSEKLNILFIGRIEKFKRLDLLIKALISIKDRNIVLNVIGEGKEKCFLMKKYSDVNFEINWLGQINDNMEKNTFFSQAHLGVMPGSGGLVIQELQSYAIPVIASYSDGTEIDLVKNINPLLFIEDMGLEELVSRIEYFKKASIEDKCQLALSAHEIVKNSYNLQNMVKITSNFVVNQLN